MGVFALIGLVGLLVLVASLIGGDLLAPLFRGLRAGGVESTPVVASFVAGFGLGTALILGRTSAGVILAMAAGIATGVVAGGVALMTRRDIVDSSRTRRGPTGS